jgi:hypothetical protein
MFLKAVSGMKKFEQVSSTTGSQRDSVKFIGAKMNSPCKRVKWERGNFPGSPIEVAERRPKVAHGETVGIKHKTEKAPDRAKEIFVGDFLPPLPGLEID